MSFFINKPIVNYYTIDTTNYKTFVEKFKATANQTVFTLTNSYEVGKNRLEVTVEGVQQFTPDNYTETSSNTITFAEGLPVGTDVVVEVTKIINV